MTVRNVSSTLITGPGSFSGWEPKDVYVRSQDGTNTPKELRRYRHYTENRYVGNTSLTIHDGVAARFSPGGQVFFMSTQTIGGVPVPVETLTYPDPYSLVGKLEGKWKQSQFNAGVFAAEGKDALDMMYHRLMGIYAAARSLKRGNFAGALRNLLGSVPPPAQRRSRNAMDGGDISGAWLELNLGWSPMIKDIYGATELIRFSGWKNRVQASAKVKCPMRASGDPSQWVVEGQGSKGTKIIVICSKPPTELQRWGLTDPAGVLWEATRLSFVVDWFVPINRYLANLHAVGAIPVEKVILVNYEKNYGKSFAVTTPVGGVYPVNYLFHGIKRDWNVHREVYDSLFDVIGTLGWLPSNTTPKWAVNTWRVFTASSLVDQALRALKARR